MNPVVTIVSAPISVEAVMRKVSSKKAGGTVVFVGTVRDSSTSIKRVSRMHIEAARQLAKRDLTRIAEEAARKFKPSGIAVSHRIGTLRPGDKIVVIAASAPHRREAFSACAYIVDEMKKTTPIWKKEFGGGRSQWVEPEEGG